MLGQQQEPISVTSNKQTNKLNILYGFRDIPWNPKGKTELGQISGFTESSGILSLHHFLVLAWCSGLWFSAAQRVHALTFRSQSYEETGWLSPIPNPSFWRKESDWSTVGQLSNLVELAVAVGQGLLQQKLGCLWQWEEKGIVHKKGQNYCELCWHPSDSGYKGCMLRAWQTQDRRQLSHF